MTYQELDAQAGRLAHRLRGLGVKPGDRVVICATRSIPAIVGVVGILKAGAAYVPLDPELPAERLGHMMAEVRPAAGVIDRSLRPAVAAVDIPILCLDDPLPDPAAVLDSDEVEPETLAYVLFTSGSTGQPKGVLMPHGPLVNLIQWHQESLPLACGSRVLQFAPLGFDVSFQEIFTTLAGDGTLVLMQEELRRDPAGLLRYLIAQRIQRLFLPFVALQQLAEEVAATGRVPAALIDVITAGEQLQITDAIRALFRRLPSARLHNHYGPTETHVVTAHVLSGDPARWPALPPIGHPIAGTRIHLLDPAGHPVPVGAVGEIHIAGACVSAGYLDRAGLTAERFLPDPFDPGARMYRTGDLSRQGEGGEFEYLGRNDAQIKVRGHRIEPGEVEASLRRHPAVRACAVVAQATGAEKILAAYFVPRTIPAPAAGELHEFLRGVLPEPMLPSRYFPIDRLPLTASGKLDRRVLSNLGGNLPAIAANTAPLKGALEQTIAAIWETVLGTRDFGPELSFFAAGGTSLMMTNVRRGLESALGREIPMPILFRFPTIRSLATELGGEGRTQAQPRTDVATRAARQREAMARQTTMPFNRIRPS